MRLAPAAAILLVLAVAAPAQATYPGKPGPIHFGRIDTSGSSPKTMMFSVRPQGGAVKELPVPEGLGTAFSPSGKSMAFADYYGSQLYVARADGSDAKVVARGGNPSWSPDGRYIAYQATPDGGDDYLHIYVLDRHTGASRHVTTGFSPAWSPDGRQILFNDDLADDTSALYSIRPDGSGRRVFYRHKGTWTAGADWSPGGRAVAVVIGRRGAVISSSGRFSRFVTPTVPGLGGLSWSPSGHAIAYGVVAGGFGEYGALYVTDDRGGKRRHIGEGVSPAWRPLR